MFPGRFATNLAALAIALAMVGVGCQTADPEPPVPGAPAATDEPPPSSKDVSFSPKKTAHRLLIMHTSDNEADLLGHAAESASDVSWGGVARATSLLRALRTQSDAPALTIAAGDTLMPAPDLKIQLDGKNAVARSNNLLGYQASALGNHEFDLGEAFLAEFIREANFPYLSCSLEFEGGPLDEIDVENDELTAENTWLAHHAGRILPRGKICAGGELTKDPQGKWTCSGLTVGVVGATTDSLRTISNISDHVRVADGLDGVKRAIQRHVDALTAEGVDVIVLASHLQDIRRELELIDLGLVGVDVIISGGGDNRLADKGDRLLPKAEPDALCATEEKGCYPMLRRARDGRAVALVGTDGQLQYVGHLMVSFDDEGALTGFDTLSSRPWAVDEQSLVELRAEPARDAVAFETELRNTLAPLLTPFAHSDVFLDGTREGVRNRETNLANLSTDAMLWAARQADAEVAFALRNGGGIRSAIGTVDADTYERRGSPLRPLDVQSSFRFDNPIVVIEASHQMVRETLESGLRGAGTSRGHFPQISGNSFLGYSVEGAEQTHVVENGSVVALGCPGARVRELHYKKADGSSVPVVQNGVTVTPEAKIKVATLLYLSRGGDAYFPATAQKLAPQPTEIGGEKLTEQSSFREFILALEKQGEWKRGANYPRVNAEDPASHQRIRRLNEPLNGSAVPPQCTHVKAGSPSSSALGN